MAYKISDDCISCGACEPECPNAAIKEGDTTFVIDPAKCTECVGSNPSPKCAETCPVGAPVVGSCSQGNQRATAREMENSASRPNS